jgi:hypothetical protein
MLETLRQGSRSIGVWILFIVIIAAFVLFFGPQSGRDQFACNSDQQIPLRVNQVPVREQSFRFAYDLVARAPDGRKRAFDFLVERELLAQAAEEAGFRVSDDLVNSWIMNGEYLHDGFKRTGGWFQNGVFDYELLQRTAYSLRGLTVEGFIAEQRREHLANLQRDVLASVTTAADEEVRAVYIHNMTRVTIDYLKFDVAEYARAIRPTEADLLRFAAGNEKEMQAAWEKAKPRFAVDKNWVRAQHLLVADEAKANELLKKLQGGADFAAVVREHDPESETGGNLGWRDAESMVQQKKLAELAEGVKKGELSKVVKGPQGYHILKVLDQKKGPLAFDDVKSELAEEIAPRLAAREAARKAAEKALEKARGTSLSKVFKKAEPKPNQITPEQWRQIQEQLRQQGIEPPKEMPGSTGSLTFESENIPAQAGTEPTPAPAPALTPPPAPAAVPAAGNVPEPQVETVGPFPNMPFIAGIGENPELARDLFTKLEVGKVAPTIYEIKGGGGGLEQVGGGGGEAFVVVELIAREDADIDKLDDQRRESLRRDMGLAKAAMRIYDWVRVRCAEAAKKGRIEIVSGFLREDDSTAEVGYAACETLSLETVTQQLMTQTRPPEVAQIPQK